MRSKVGCASQGYLQDKAEVSGCFVLVSVVFGGVDVEILEADEAGEVSGALQDRQVEKTQPIRRFVRTTRKTFPQLGSFPVSPFQPVHHLTRSADLTHRCAFLLINSHESVSHLSEMCYRMHVGRCSAQLQHIIHLD